jgi:flagellar biosynthesis protein FliR
MELDIYNWALVFLRVSAFLLVLPFFSVANFPVMMRVALSVLMAMLLAPMLPPFTAGRLDLLSLLGLMFQEVSVGLLLGFVARMVFFAVDLAGSIISMQIGLNMATQFDPASSQTEQTTSTILFFLVFSGDGGDADAEPAPLDPAGVCADVRCCRSGGCI